MDAIMELAQRVSGMDTLLVVMRDSRKCASARVPGSRGSLLLAQRLLGVGNARRLGIIHPTPDDQQYTLRPPRIPMRRLNPPIQRPACGMHIGRIVWVLGALAAAYGPAVRHIVKIFD
jgi:hypothetical protein